MKERLDVLLVNRGLAPSREKAKTMIMEGNVFVNNNREDKGSYPALGQELPAVYTNGEWWQVVSYVGNEPYTGGAVTHLYQKTDNCWLPSLRATEHWSAMVDDNGFGVKDENLDRLFTPNFTTKSSGTGLGLAICRNIIEKCEGEIRYQRSFALGGAAFVVTIPKHKA
mgnify:CR=1 FL=1